MANDVVSIKADGPVTLADLVNAAAALSDLMAAITREAGSDAPVDWLVADLRPGSATVVSRPAFGTVAGKALAALAVSRFEQIARNAHLGRIEGYPPTIQEPLRRAARLLNERVTDVRLGSGVDDESYSIDRSLAEQDQEDDAEQPEYTALRPFVRTSIKGQVVLLDAKKGVYFTLRRAGTGEYVRCYPRQPDAALREQLSNLWKRQAWVIVEGTYTQRRRNRDWIPTLHHITDMVELPAPEPGGWRRAVGVAPRKAGGSDMTAAEAVRKVRDGEA